MKKNLTLAFASLLAFFFLTCTEDQKITPTNEKVEFTLDVAPQRTDEEEMLSTEAKAEIYDGSTLISTFSLQAQANNIRFNGHHEKPYELIVSKPGYDSYEMKFTYSNVMKDFQGKALKVALKPVVEIAILSTGSDPYEFIVEGKGEITISGISSMEGTHQLPYTFNQPLPKGKYTVRIKGDLHRITTLEGFGYPTGITSIKGLKHLTHLKKFSPGEYIDSKLDLSGNRKLEWVELQLEFPEWITLPDHHSLKIFNLITGEIIPQAQVDELVANIYRNAIKRSIYNGHFYIYPTETLSAESLNKLKKLRDQYQWTIYIYNDIFE